MTARRDRQTPNGTRPDERVALQVTGEVRIAIPVSNRVEVALEHLGGRHEILGSTGRDPRTGREDNRARQRDEDAKAAVPQ